MPRNGETFKASTVAEWKQKSIMRVTLGSGANVAVRALTLDELAALEALPDDLLRVALLEQTPGGVVGKITANLERGKPDDLADAKVLSGANVALVDRLVLAAVVEPKLRPADVKTLDPFDKAEIAAFAQRRRNIDAAGRRVGADALDSFREGSRILARSETDPARKALLLELADIH